MTQYNEDNRDFYLNEAINTPDTQCIHSHPNGNSQILNDNTYIKIPEFKYLSFETFMCELMHCITCIFCL